MASNNPSFHQDDEINLIELGLLLWRKKFLIMGLTAVFTILAAVYAFTATPIFQVQSILRTTSIKNLEPINTSEILTIGPNQALKDVGAKLDSYDSRLRFFRENKKLFEELRQPGETLEQSFERFNEKAFTLLRPDLKTDPNATPYIGIRLQYPEGVDGVQIVNEFVAFAINEEKEDLEANYNALLEHRILNTEKELIALRTEYDAQVESKVSQLLEEDALKRARLLDELAAVRTQLELNRENRIKRLQEAIAIATALNIHKPTSPTLLGRNIQEMPGFYAELSNQSPPLYFMGTEALQAELDVLLAREDNDFTSGRITEIQKELQLLEQNRQVELLKARENRDLFIAEQATIKRTLAYLENLHIDFEMLEIVKIDRPAHTPYKPIKPNKKLVVAVGFLLGLMIGVFFALVKGALRNHKKLAA